jgi:hypothetical protein
VRQLRNAIAILLAAVLLSWGAEDKERYQRIANAGKLWAYLHIFHPWFGYRDDIDWESYWVKAFDQISTATNTEQWRAALEKMTGPFGPSQVVLSGNAQRSIQRGLPSSRMTEDGILIVRVPAPDNYNAAGSKIAGMRGDFDKAKAMVLDLRFSGDLRFLLAGKDGLINWFLTKPLEPLLVRQRVHEGLAGPSLGGYRGYHSAWVQGPYTIETSPEFSGRDVPVVVLTDGDSTLPVEFLSLQDEGRASILAEGGQIQAFMAWEMETLDVGNGVRAYVRYREVLMPDGSLPAPNRSFAAESEYKEDTPAFRARSKWRVPGGGQSRIAGSLRTPRTRPPERCIRMSRTR